MTDRPADATAERTIRAPRDDDADALIELVGGCWAEYPGCVMDVDGENPHLRAIATAYERWGGRAWVVEGDGGLVASIGLTLAGGGALAKGRALAGEIHMLYVAKAARRAGLAGRLLGLAEAEAMRRGVTRMELWSDTRFLDAHRFYARHGYSATGVSRELHDLSDTTEYHFTKELGGGSGR